MTFKDYEGKRATIKSIEVEGIIKNVIHKRGADNKLGARFLVEDQTGKVHELMPHELTVHLYE